MKKSNDNKHWQVCGEIKTITYDLWESKMVHITLKNSLVANQMFKYGVIIWSSKFTPNYITERS
jgi:hypothetical protein